MITDTLREHILAEIKNKIVFADLGLGGNSTNPNSTALDVPLDLTSSQVTITKSESDYNLLEIKVSVSGNTIDGKVIREMGLKDDGSALSPARSPNADFLVHRVNFAGIGPIATTDTLEIFILMEVE